MEFPVFSLLTGNFSSRDGFARDCPLQRRVINEPQGKVTAKAVAIAPPALRSHRQDTPPPRADPGLGRCNVVAQQARQGRRGRFDSLRISATVSLLGPCIARAAASMIRATAAVMPRPRSCATAIDAAAHSSTVRRACRGSRASFCGQGDGREIFETRAKPKEPTPNRGVRLTRRWRRQSGANSVSEPKFPVIQGKYREFPVLSSRRHEKSGTESDSAAYLFPMERAM